MKQNAFKCPYCDKYTKQIEVSWGEVSAIEKDSKVQQIGLRIGDYIGMTDIAGKLFDKTYYKCCECGLITRRNSAGDYDDYCNWPRK